MSSQNYHENNQASSNPRKRSRVWDSVYCSHCEQLVSKSTYYRHRSVASQSQADSSLTDRHEQSVHSEDEEVIMPDTDLNDSEASYDFQSTSEEDVETESRSRVFGEHEREYISDCSSSCSEDDDSTNQGHDGDRVEVWSSSEDSDTEYDDDTIEKRKEAVDTPFHMLFVFILLWQATYNISSAGVSSFLRFLKFFICHVGKAISSELLVQASSSIPATIGRMEKIAGLSKQSFTEYVVCPKCSCIFEYNDCVQMTNGKKESKRCCHVEFPNHPQRSRRQPCSTILLKSYKTKKGNIVLTPQKAYPYRSLKRSILQLLKRPGFVEKCEQWRSRASVIPKYFFGDVYDGNVWKQFCTEEYNNFLTNPHSYLLTLNIDWFQPFKRTVYSTGAIYLTIQNLPRNERYKQENVILVGLMPGPKESSLNINSFLTPLVEELQEFWSGQFVPVPINGSMMHICVRLALSCVACDIPASRKVSGFLGHNARLGCNKCLKEFDMVPSSGGQKTDYSGYDRETWAVRTSKQHREYCSLISKETNPSAKQRAESRYGVRYSILLALPYFDPVAYTVVDPMHNLFLGTGKHVFKLWIDRQLLSNAQLSLIESNISKFRTPLNVGRVPSNISSGHSGYTANQWSNWITIYSPVVLKDILPNEHLRCWLLFVRACSLLRSNTLRKQDLNTADLLLLQFCRLCQSLYGSGTCTPNMHLHLHLKQCLIDYGPCHAFWCYAFERYNGVLGSVHTNRRSIESQLMRKFCQEQETLSIDVPFMSDIHQYLPHTSQATESVTTQCNSDDQVLALLKIGYAPLLTISTFAIPPKTYSLVKALSPYEEKYFDSSLVKDLQTVYGQLYPDKRISHIPYFYKEYGRVSVAGEMIGSVKRGRNCQSSSVIAAYWPGTGNNLAVIDNSRMRVGIVQYFIKHCLMVYKAENDSEVENLEHIFAYINWKKIHPNSSWFGISATVSSELTEIPAACSFMPVQRIGSRCAYASLKVTFPSHTETVFVTCPIPLTFTM